MEGHVRLSALTHSHILTQGPGFASADLHAGRSRFTSTGWASGSLSTAHGHPKAENTLTDPAVLHLEQVGPRLLALCFSATACSACKMNVHI